MFLDKVKLNTCYFVLGLFCIFQFAAAAYGQQDKAAGLNDWSRASVERARSQQPLDGVVPEAGKVVHSL